ncbi:MAG TPA: DNA-3-methyladenine glycosylase 2 family protein [Mesorhizobium sp.]|jgi:DNA-3-methyladenine glycosylase II|nr:DNA-3-methyladenine glycosylase 2 family protein [Mesorhizobium sp.]
MRLVKTPADIEDGLEALLAADPRLLPVRARAGATPLRGMEPGFASLCSIITSQQVSTASAAAIFSRLQALLEPLTPDAVRAADDAVFRAAGLSAAKVRALRAAADAVAGGLDLSELCGRPTEAAILELVRVPGIGRWTAESYLLFAAGHPDVFPARDVALQAAVGHAFTLDARPGEKALEEIARAWSPWRSVAARLFWAYYRTMRGRDGAPAA